ncbi:hypothetical protein FOZ62_011586 [Perkinsus olseni]|uniref:C2H2-type domain-containing protein n=1 Tax=Perkinsus olseni TaxID=32597 RepID=A0A7J6U3M3_PEROL|nr:hypothetical protein FOZ62_011586 [Perkinsus olseni]
MVRMMKTISSTISSPRLKTALQSTSISRFPASVQLKNSEGVRSPVNKFLCCSTLRFVSQLENETKDFAEDRPRPNTNSRSDSVSEDNGGREESSDTEIEDQRCNKNAESEPERIPLTGKRKGRPPTLIDGKRKCRQTRTTKRAATFECSLCTKKCTSMNRLKQHRRLAHNLS